MKNLLLVFFYSDLKDCFACFDDGSCIESGKLCDMSIDCPDKSDELNCGK